MQNETITLGYVVKNSGDKRPFGLIFIGKNDRPTGLTGASKLLIVTGSNAVQSQAEFTSDPFNVPAEFLAKLGINGADVPDGARLDVRELGITGADVFGCEVAIQTTETTEKPFDKAKPVMNPTTMEVKNFNGQPVYRVKTVVVAEEKKNTFLQFDAPVVPQA